ncbi:MAG: hypothetical protein RIE77_14350 [Phycisphaerales bacterium]|jgi:hypothetical protein
MASEADELRKIRKRVEALNPPSVGCGVFVGLWLFLGSLLVLRGCFGVDVLGPLRHSPEAPATSAEQVPGSTDGQESGVDPAA